MTERVPAALESSRAGAAAFVHEWALVETDDIGPGTRIWAFAHVMAGARIGADCNICDHTFLEGDVVVGDRVTIKSGVYLWDGLRVEDDVFLGPQATFTNDRFPRSKQPFECPVTTIRRGASIGAGAVVLPGITVGEQAMVGAGAVLTRDVPDHAVAVGNPARVVRMLDSESDSDGASPA
jgi:acetyltransferase-like isoleucine patch superfamily enzyme